MLPQLAPSLSGSALPVVSIPRTAASYLVALVSPQQPVCRHCGSVRYCWRSGPVVAEQEFGVLLTLPQLLESANVCTLLDCFTDLHRVDAFEVVDPLRHRRDAFLDQRDAGQVCDPA